MAKPDGERVAALEATMVAFEKNQQALEHKVDAGFTSVGAKLDALNSKIGIMHTENENRFVGMNDFIAFRDNVNGQLSKRWVSSTLSAILGAVLTGLVGAVWFFITRQ